MNGGGGADGERRWLPFENKSLTLRFLIDMPGKALEVARQFAKTLRREILMHDASQSSTRAGSRRKGFFSRIARYPKLCCIKAGLPDALLKPATFDLSHKQGNEMPTGFANARDQRPDTAERNTN